MGLFNFRREKEAPKVEEPVNEETSVEETEEEEKRIGGEEKFTPGQKERRN